MSLYRRHHGRGAPAAMTLVELVMSLCILVLVGLALAALCSVSGQNWQYSESRQNMRMQAMGSANQVTGMLRGARLIGVAYSDGNLTTATATAIPATGTACVSDGVTRSAGAGAACMFWMDTAATTIVLQDVAVLEHDMTGRQLVLWQVPSTASNAGVTLGACDLDDPNDVEKFKILPNVVKRVVARNVTSCRFNTYAVNGSATPQTIEFFVRLQDGSGERDEYWTVTPRASVSSTSGL